MLYNLSEFMTLVKERAEINDIPLPISDKEIIRHFDISALREFSVRYPYITQGWLTSKDAIDLSTRSLNGAVEYVIPEKYYQGTEILDVTHLLPGGYGSEANMYMPNVVLGSADMLLESVADIKMAAALGSMMTHAPTREFHAPDRLIIFNGWTSGSFRIELALKHDLSLATVPNGAFTNLLELATLDLEAYLYSKLKRKNNIETGIGNIDMKIDNWESASRDMRELLNTWDETSEFSTAEIMYF